ncbi:MAG: FAD-linked oxidase C-terminal domain-containing protein [Polyangiaceae bacterium]
MLISAPKVKRASAAQTERALVDLHRALGPSKVEEGSEACARFAGDESEAERVMPDAVVHAMDANDIVATLEVAERHGVPVTPRAGGTGRTGGAIPVAGGIVLDTSTLSKVKDIDRKNFVAVVEPGLVTGRLHALCEAEGLFYPPDPNSLESCMIGGNVAENAGGPRAFKYGVTRDYVLGIEACLIGGTRFFAGKRTVKGVVGYDMTALLVGSEGTLAVFSELTLKLVKKPAHIVTLLALFSDVAACADAVSHIMDEGFVPRCMELMDGPTLRAMRGQGVAIDPRAEAMLLIELDDRDGDVVLEPLGNLLLGKSRALDVQVAQDESRRAALWSARRALSPVTRKIAKYKLSEDIVVPRSRISELLLRVDEHCAKESVQHLTYGHAGDGNLHVNYLWNDPSERGAVDRAITALMHEVVSLGGTISGEHGIGITKMEYIGIEQPAPLIALQREVKRVFDPKELLNPGKMFPTASHGQC